ncbi:MAG TPA: hypothetical protein VF158_14375 [Longimicrobiales bacterium]
MNDDRIDSLLRDAAREYNPPPEPPREAMWARIQEERRRRDAGRGTRRIGPAHWGIGMAAMLAIGIGLGRLAPVPSGPAPSSPAATAEPRPAGPRAELPYHVAAMQHLSRTEAFLASYRSETRAGLTTRDVSEWARELLTGTRLLLDSPAAEDPRLESLLQDLELVLTQLARLDAAEDTAGEAEMIDDALERRGTLFRLRAAVQAGPAVSGT